MNTYKILTTGVNSTRGHLIYEDPQPREYIEENLGALFRTLRKEYGRCISKVYWDRTGRAVATGWVFVRRQQYTDTRESYLHETWCEIVKPVEVMVPATKYTAVSLEEA